jgi:hypothetical protein
LQSLYLQGFRDYLPQHCLYFLPLPQGKKFRAFGSISEHFRAFFCPFLLLGALESTRETYLKVSKKVSKIQKMLFFEKN